MRIFRECVLQLAIAGAYVAAGRLGLLVPAGHHIITLVWAPTGIALAAVVLAGFRVLPALAVAAFVTNVAAGAPAGVAAAVAVGNPLEAALGAALLRAAQFRPALTRARDVLALAVLGAGVSTLASAAVGVGALLAAGQIPAGGFARNALEWWLGDAMGDLVVAPLLFTAAAAVREGKRAEAVRRLPEAAAIALATGAAAAAVFLLPAPGRGAHEVAFVVFPFLFAAAFRLGPPGAAAASFLTVAIAVAGTLVGRGPFADQATRAGIAALHLFTGTAALSALLFAAALAERHEAQEALRRSEEEGRRERKMEALGLMAAGIADEFGGLLSAIREHARMLEARVGLDDGRRPSVEAILAAADRAEEAKRRILSLGRGGSAGAAVPVDVAGAIRGLVPVMAPLLGKLVVLSLELEAGLGCVKMDPRLLERVLLSLVLNAREAMPGGGRLEIRAAAAGDGGVDISVADTGRGMDAETLGRVFEPFFTTKPAGERGGLGLAMVHAIVTRSGGTVRAASEPGRGTRISIRLPAVPCRRSAGREAGSREAARGGRETILVAVAQEAAWQAIRRALSAHGYEVLVAPGGAQALRTLREHAGPVDLLLVDAELPGLSGAEVASRAVLERPGLRTLFLSSRPADAAGRDGSRVLFPPFSPDVLAVRVRAELDAAGPHPA